MLSISTNRLLSLMVALFLLGCSKVSKFRSDFDAFTFSWLGRPVFGEPLKVTTKQLHLDTGELVGQDLILEGELEEKGEAGTHLILSDSDGRMLVVLTMIDSPNVLEGQQTSQIRVLGTLEHGKKGMPFVLARAVRPLDASRN